MKDENIIRAIEESELELNSDTAQGRLQLRYARSGTPASDQYFTRFDVVLLRLGTVWTIVGTADGSRLDITLDQGANTLNIMLHNYEWNLQATNPNISIVTSADQSEILIRFIGNIESTTYTGRHYNLMRGSILAVKSAV